MNRDAGFPRRADKGGALFPPDKEPMSATIDLSEPMAGTRFRPVVPPPLKEPLGLFEFTAGSLELGFLDGIPAGCE